LPQFKVTGPDGKSYRVNTPQGATQDDAIAYIANSYYGAPAAPAPEAEVPQAPEQPKEELGFFGALKRGFTTLGDVPEALGFATGKEGARQELVKAQEGEEQRAEGFGLDKTLGENVQALKELAGESIGFMAAPAAAGLAGTFVGGPVAGGGAAIATLLSQYGTQNLARQAQEDEARVARGEAPLGAMPGRAAAAAVGQAGLDVAGFALPALRPMAAAFPFMRPLIGAGGKKAAAETAEAIVEAAAKKQLTIKGGIARGVAQGAAFEVPQEVAQTTLERWQAGLSLDDDSAIEEYKQAAIGAVILGGGFSGIGGGINAAREQVQQKKEEDKAPPDLATPEQKTEFADLLTTAVTSYVEANPSASVQDALKALRDDGTLVSLGEQAKADVQQAQEAQAETETEAGAGLDGGDRGPDVDVAGAAGPSVPDTGVVPPTEEVAEGPPPAEPIGVAGVGEPVGGAAAPEAGADGALTEAVAPVPEVAPAAPVAAPAEVAPTVDLTPAYEAKTSKAKMDAVKPVVTDIFSRLSGLDVSKPQALPEPVRKALNTSIQQVHNAVKSKSIEAVEPEAVVRQQMAKFDVALPEVAAPTMEAVSVPKTPAPAAAPLAPSPVEAATPETAAREETVKQVTAPSAPAYTYADLTAEADSLVASNPDLVLPGQLTAQQFQQFTIQSDAVAEAAKQGLPVPSPVELRQRLYEVVGREAPPLETPAAPEPAAAEEYDADAMAAAATQAPSVWATLSKQVKGKPPAAWDTLEEEAQDEFIAAIAAAPSGVPPLEFAATVRPVFNAIRTGKPIPAAPAPEVVAPEAEVAAESAPAPTPAAPATKSTTLESYQDVALSVMWFSGGSRTLVAGAKTPSWVPDDVLVYDKTNIAPATDEKPDVRVEQFKAKDGTVGTKVSVSVPSVDEQFGPRDNTAAATIWLRDATPANVGSAVQTAEVVARWVANKNNSKAANGPITQLADEAIKFVAKQGGTRTAAPAAPAPTAPASEAAPAPEPQIEVEVEPTPKAGGVGKPPKPPKPPKSTSGAAPQPGGKGPKKPRVIKITKSKMQWAMREAGLMRRRNDAFRKKILRSQNAQQLNDSIGDMFFGTRAYQGPMNMLRLLRDSLTPQAKRVILPFLPTDDITRWVGDRLPEVARVNKLIDDLTVYRNKRHEKTSVIANKWTKFMTAFPKGADTLDVLIKLADYHDVDPTQAATAEEYAKSDPEMKRLVAGKASKQKRDNRLSAIREVYAEWAALGSRESGSGAGREVFKLAKEAYRRNLVDSYILTLNRISEAGMSADNEKAAISQIKYMYKEALSRRVYFPAMRYGKFWFSVGKGASVEYYMFESALQRDMAFIKRREDMAEENDVRGMVKGNDYKEVTDYLTKGRDASVALKDVFELLDSGNADDTVALKDTIFQMYLLALPEGDMRKRFSHRRYVTGFGMDSMRDFVSAQNRAASQLARLSYAHQVRLELSTLEENAKEREDFVDLEAFVREISERAKAEVDPPLRGGFYAWMDKFATLGNKVVFLWMLTAPKSALIQATQLHTVGLPVLSDEFGFGKVMKIAGQYSGDILLGNKLAIHRKDANGDIITEFDLNMRNAKFMQELEQSDPKKYKLLLEAFDYADRRGTFASTYISDLNDNASRPSREGSALAALKRGRPISAAVQGGQAAMQFMSAGFHQMENLNRQIMYMTSFELAYEQAKKGRMSDAAAKEAAMERALKVTRETMFNYSNYNKPRAFKNPVGRIATQFMTYPVMMTSYLARNFKNMISGLPAEAKMSAAKRFFGTLGVTAMYAGLTGLPLYSVIMAAAEAARELLRDDDDFAPYEDDKGNPVGKVDLKYWFENSWLPETFGPDSSVAEALNIPPELAVLLERSVKFGPISAISDINVASSTSLDSLFFRGDVKADTLEGQFKDMLYNQLLGPLGGLVSNMTRGVQLYDEGETTRAMELMLPAFVKGAVRASRLEDEGLRTIDGKIVKDAEFYTMGKLFSQIMGFGSTEAYEAQKQNIEGKQIVDEIKAERATLIQEDKNAGLRYLDKPSETTKRAADRAYKKLESFNNRYPFSPVGGDTIGEAMSNSLEERAGSVGGAKIEPDYPVMDDVIARRIARGQQ
jgi:hypothetical protein